MRQCLVIAAGRGSRLASGDLPKPLFRLPGLPLIERSIVTAQRAGLEKFTVVTGCNGARVTEFLDRLALCRGITITPVVNQKWDGGNGLSVLAAREASGHEPFASGGALWLAAGGLLAQAASVVDGCDSEVARLRLQESDFGGWFDAVLDRYADAFLLFSLTWHVFFAADGSPLALFVGFMAITGSFLVSYTADRYDGLMKARFQRGKALGIRVGRDLRVLLIALGAVFNLPFVALSLLAAVMNTETVRRIVTAGHGRDPA